MGEQDSTRATPRPLRFGVMCRGRAFAAWEAACIRELLAVEGVEPALLIVDDSVPQPPTRRERARALLDPRTLGWRLYQRAVLNRGSRSTRPVDLSAELAAVPAIRCRPLQSGKWVQRLRAEDVAAIREHRLDFVLRFAFNILKGDVLDCATHGIWSFHHDDPDKYRGQPPGFWELYHRDPVVGVVLQRLTERLDAGHALHRGWFRAAETSYVRTRDAVFFGAADWPARLCRQMQAEPDAPLPSEPLKGSAPIYRAPNSLHMLRFGWNWLRATVRDQVGSVLRVQQWGVAVIDAPVAEVAGLADPTATERHVRRARWLPEPPGRFLADPFAVPRDGGALTILAEDFDWESGRGRIAQVEVGADGAATPPRLVIETDWHLSYPYLLRHEGELLCIPEMHQANRATVYRADAALQTWTAEATLIDGLPLVDPTVFLHEGRWWLFGTREDLGANLKLYAWHADAPTGPWTPHAANPLKTDIRSSRPAGPPFVHNGALYRPAQDCSTGYGAAVVVHRVERLTPTAFEEVAVSRIAPDPAGRYPTGLHTLCGAGGRTVIDGSRAGFQRRVAAETARRKLRRLLPGRR